MDRFKIAWRVPDTGTGGNALGYNTHRRFMMKYSEKYFINDPSADVVIHITPGDRYDHVPGKINVLFTMWEASVPPASYVLAINQADLVIVPSRFCRDLFKQYTTKPIEVCWEGVEPESFPYYQRIEPIVGQKFRFLWCGAPNPRKGYLSILEAIRIIEQSPDVEIYLKTTTDGFDRKKYVSRLWQERKNIRRLIREKQMDEVFSVKKQLHRATVAKGLKPEGEIRYHGKYKNVIFDNRKIPLAELVGLYNSAHCFLFPTMGEGWGLTLCEAMATGCPCVATPVTGCADFFDAKVGYIIQSKIFSEYLDNYDVVAGMHAPDTVDFVSQLFNAYHNYQDALAKGRRASERIHSRFTWAKSASRLNDIILEHYGRTSKNGYREALCVN